MNPLDDDDDDAFAESETLVRDDEVVQKALSKSGLPASVINPTGKNKPASSAKRTMTLQPNKMGKLPSLGSPSKGSPLSPLGGKKPAKGGLRIPSPADVASGKRGRGLALSMPAGSPEPQPTLAGTSKAKRDSSPASGPEAATILNIDFEEKQKAAASAPSTTGDSLAGPTIVDMDFDGDLGGMEPSKTTAPGGPKAAQARDAKRDIPQHKGRPQNTPVPELTSRPAGKPAAKDAMGNAPTLMPDSLKEVTPVPKIVGAAGHKLQSGPAKKPSGIEFRTPAGLKANAGGPMPGGPMQGGPMQGGPTPGGPMQGGPTPGGAMQGGPMQGGPMQGGPMQGGPMQGGPMQGGPGMQGMLGPGSQPGIGPNFPPVTTPTAFKQLGQPLHPQPNPAYPTGDALALAREHSMSGGGPASWLVAVVFLISVGAGLGLSLLLFK
jgi:hypothetical protein